jgi:hypothetical protein
MNERSRGRRRAPDGSLAEPSRIAREPARGRGARAGGVVSREDGAPGGAIVSRENGTPGAAIEELVDGDRSPPPPVVPGGLRRHLS